MAPSGNQDTSGDAPVDDPTIEAAAHVEEVVHATASGDVVTPAGEAFTSSTSNAVLTDDDDADEPTVVRSAIPPLLTDPEAADAQPGDQPGVEEAANVEGGEEPTALGAPASKERVAEAAAAARERVTESAADARQRATDGAALAKERGAEVAAQAKEKTAEAAAQAREKTAEAAAQAKEKSARARARFASAASDAKGRASSVATEARERAANADVEGFARNTTSLIDTARPFFLAGCAALFAVLGFLEGDAGTAQVFAVGAVVFVIGAAFSGEINAFLASRSHVGHKDDAAGKDTAGD